MLCERSYLFSDSWKPRNSSSPYVLLHFWWLFVGNELGLWQLQLYSTVWFKLLTFFNMTPAQMSSFPCTDLNCSILGINSSCCFEGFPLIFTACSHMIPATMGSFSSFLRVSVHFCCRNLPLARLKWETLGKYTNMLNRYFGIWFLLPFCQPLWNCCYFLPPPWLHLPFFLLFYYYCWFVQKELPLGWGLQGDRATCSACCPDRAVSRGLEKQGLCQCKNWAAVEERGPLCRVATWLIMNCVEDFLLKTGTVFCNGKFACI